jgi:ribosomal protein L30/L7E
LSLLLPQRTKKRPLTKAASITIQKIAFSKDSGWMSFMVTLSPELDPMTSNLNVALLFEEYPDLHKHRCLSGRARSFENEAKDTELVHLLEHLAVEIMVQKGASRQEARGQTGIPENHASNVYGLRLKGAQELVIVDALRQAIMRIESLLD